MNATTTARLRRVRIVAAFSMSALVFGGLTACGSDDSGKSDTGSAGGSKAKAMTIQFVNPLPSYPTWKLIGKCMKERAVQLGAKYSESGPSGQAVDPAAQIKQLQQAVANKRDAIITFPTSAGFASALKQAQKAGSVTGTIYGPGGRASGADYNIGPDFKAIGEALVGGVAKLPGKHVIGLVAVNNTAGLGKSWLDGVKAAVKRHSNVSIVGEVYTGDDATKALPQVNALLTAHPGITDIVTHMGTTTPGAVSVIKSKGLKGKTFLVAVGHDNGGSQAAKDGTAKLLLMQDVCSLGKELVDGVVAVHNHKKPHKYPVKVAVIPASQLQKYLANGWV
jgi:ribose transport system substrate-binding protein